MSDLISAMQRIARLEDENERLRANLDEAVVLLNRAAFRLVPLSPYGRIREFLDRLASDEGGR